MYMYLEHDVQGDVPLVAPGSSVDQSCAVYFVSCRDTSRPTQIPKQRVRCVPVIRNMTGTLRNRHDGEDEGTLVF